MTPLRTVFSCDLRTLAVFRLGLGLSLLVDLVSRARDLRAHYTFFGVVPQPTNSESFVLTFFHLLVGSAWFQFGVFLLAGLSAVAVMVGYRTRLATLVSWFLLLFVQSRNNFVFQGGDKLLLLLFFWGIFLPLGARYSVDAALAEVPSNDSSNRYFSMGTVAILLQVSCLYFFSALLKNTSEWLPDGIAIYYALSLKSFVRPVGEWLLEFPVILQWLTYYVWILELVGPILIFSPWCFHVMRLSMLIQLAALHVGIVLCLNVGLFPLFNLVSLLLFIPSFCWDKMVQSVKKKFWGMGLTIFYDNECDFCRKVTLLFQTFLLLPHAVLLPAQQHPRIFESMNRQNTWVVQDQDGFQHLQWNGVLVLFGHSPIFWPLAHMLSLPLFRGIGTWLYQIIGTHRETLSRLSRLIFPLNQVSLGERRPSFVVEGFIGLLTIYMVFINVTTVPNLPITFIDPFPLVQRIFGLNQNWDMFAPSPRPWDGWYVVTGRLIDGTEVDVYNRRLQVMTIEDSSLERSPYPTYRWRKYLQNLVAAKYHNDRTYYAGYLCRAWNEGHNPLQHLHFLEIYFVKVDTPSPDQGQKPKREILKLWEQSCLKDSIGFTDQEVSPNN